jgi:hypothetical protein
MLTGAAILVSGTCPNCGHTPPLPSRAFASEQSSPDHDKCPDFLPGRCGFRPISDASVDVTAADWRNCVARGGAPDRRAQGEWRQESQDSWQLHAMLRQRVDSATWRRSNIRRIARRRRDMMPARGIRAPALVIARRRRLPESPVRNGGQKPGFLKKPGFCQAT